MNDGINQNVQNSTPVEKFYSIVVTAQSLIVIAITTIVIAFIC
jgi:hypothetical protein